MAGKTKHPESGLRWQPQLQRRAERTAEVFKMLPTGATYANEL